MKNLFFILTFVFFAARSDPAAAFSCKDVDSKPEIEFTTSYGVLRYDTARNTDQITALAAHYGIVEQGLFASGLATVNVVWEISVNSMGKFYSDNNICVVPTKINVFIGFSDPVIYLSNQLKPGSCAYNVVRRHEQTHQQINKAALDYFLPLFQQAVQKIVDSVKPLPVDHISRIDEATVRLTETYNRKISPLVEVFKQELLAEQSKLDNQSNYQHEQNLCR